MALLLEKKSRLTAFSDIEAPSSASAAMASAFTYECPQSMVWSGARYLSFRRSQTSHGLAIGAYQHRYNPLAG